eukprot:c2473_g1_i1 orf=328-819(-)
MPNKAKEIWRESFEWEIEFPLQAVWELTSDFVNIHKWAPSLLANSSLVEGCPQKPGCVRLVQSHPQPSPTQAYEKLLEIDHLTHKLTYFIFDSSLPFLDGLTPTFQLVEASPTSTKVVWSYEIAPIPGFDQSALRNFILSNLYEVCISDLKNILSSPTQHSST